MRQIDSISEFLAVQSNSHGPHREWVRIKRLHLEVYLRLCTRYINDSLVRTIDVANISVDEGQRKKGNAKKLYAEIEQAADQRGLVVYVENSLHDYMQRRHLRSGYKTCNIENCFYRLPSPPA